MNIVNKIKIDISNKRAENVIDAVQGDANTRAANSVNSLRGYYIFRPKTI